MARQSRVPRLKKRCYDNDIRDIYNELEKYVYGKGVELNDNEQRGLPNADTALRNYRPEAD